MGEGPPPKHPDADQRLDPARLSAAGRLHYEMVDWSAPGVKAGARNLWDSVAAKLEQGVPAEVVAREWADHCGAFGLAHGRGPDDPRVVAAKAFAAGTISQAVSSRFRRRGARPGPGR